MGKKKQARKAERRQAEQDLVPYGFAPNFDGTQAESPNHPMRSIAEWIQKTYAPASYAVVTQGEGESKNVTLHSKGDGKWFDLEGNLVLDAASEAPVYGTKIHEALEEYQRYSPRPWESSINDAGFVGFDGIYDGLPEQSVISEETLVSHDKWMAAKKEHTELKLKPLDTSMADVLKSQAWDPLSPILANMPQAVVVGMDAGQNPIIVHTDEKDPAQRAMDKIQEVNEDMRKRGVFASALEDEAFGVNEQPAPKPNDGDSMHDLVSADMAQRKKFGLEKYGTILQAGNLRNAILDSYEESLDQIVYLRAYIEETKDAVVLPRAHVEEMLNALKVGRGIARLRVKEAEDTHEVHVFGGEEQDPAYREREDLAQISYWVDNIRKSLEVPSPKSQPDQQV